MTEPPPALDVCKVYAYIKKNDTPSEGAILEARLCGADNFALGSAMSTQRATATADANGYAELYLVKAKEFTMGDGVYQIIVNHGDAVSVNFSTTIPDLDEVSVQELLTALGN